MADKSAERLSCVSCVRERQLMRNPMQANTFLFGWGKRKNKSKKGKYDIAYTLLNVYINYKKQSKFWGACFWSKGQNQHGWTGS